MIQLFLTETRTIQLLAEAAACTDPAVLDSLWRNVEAHYGDDLRRRRVHLRMAQRAQELRAQGTP